MKQKLLSLILALVMLLGMTAQVFAEGEEPAPAPGAETAATDDSNYSKETNAKTQSVTLHKLLMTKDELKAWNADGPKGYDGTQDLKGLQGLVGSGQTLKEIAGVYFVFAKNFGTEEKPEWKYIDKAGNALAIQDVADPGFAKQANILGGLTEASGIKFDTSNLEGNFRIEEIKSLSTYKGEKNESLTDSKAVPVEITLPLVAEKGTVLNAHVYPKNTQEKPEIDKNFAKDWIKNGKNPDAVVNVDENQLIEAGAAYENYAKEKATATATIGTKVPYEVKTKVPAKSDYNHLVWSDIMTHGLTYNKDVKITATGITLADTDYKITQTASGFTLELTQSGLDKVKASTTDVEFMLTYSATVNSSAVVDVEDENEVRLIYGHKPKEDRDPKPGKPVDKKIKVTKTWSTGTAPAGVEVRYFLWEGDPKNDPNAKVVAQSPVLTSPNVDYTFENLDNDKTYYVEERVSGYLPEYTVTDGNVGVKNTPDTNNPPPLIPSKPKIVTGGKKFVKTDAGSSERLAGAKFLVKKGDKYLYKKSDAALVEQNQKYQAAEQAYQTAIKAYNDRQNDDNKDALLATIEEKRIARDEAFKAANIVYEWKDAPAKKDVATLEGTDIVILTSDNQGRFEITGLAYGDYKLEEIQAPKGYATRGDVDFTVGEGSYTEKAVDIKYNPNDEANGAMRVDNKLTRIPQTGGIGTIIFTVAGLAIMTTAVLSLKRKRKEEM